jgi:hypothetical protein
MTPPSLLILEIGSDTIGCQFLNWQRHNWLSISELAATQFSADFWIGSDTVLLLISESATTQFFVADFWIDSNVVLLPISKSTAAQLLAADF